MYMVLDAPLPLLTPPLPLLTPPLPLLTPPLPLLRSGRVWITLSTEPLPAAVQTVRILYTVHCTYVLRYTCAYHAADVLLCSCVTLCLSNHHVIVFFFAIVKISIIGNLVLYHISFI
jgi:hypothetical protein